MSERSAQARAIVSRAFRNESLRRVVLAYGLFFGAEWAVWISFLVYGYTHGGASAAMTIALVQVLPSAVLAPLFGAISDGYRPGRVLFAGYLAEAAAMVAACVLITVAAPKYAVFAIALVVNLAITVARPAQAALVPAIVRTPEELTASNVLTGWCQSAGELIAPVLAGLLMAVHGPALAIAGTALLALVAAVLVVPVPGAKRVRAGERSEGEFRSGFSVVARDPMLGVLLGVQGFYQVLVGASDLLVVILALSILHIGQGGAGYLNAAIGVGAVLAGAVTVGLIGRSKLAGTGVFAFLGATVILAVIGFNTTVILAFIFLAAVGLCGGLFDVTARTLLQRAAPPESLASAFSVLESLMNFGLALGVVIVRGSVAIGGDRGAFWIPGLAGVVVIVLLARRLFAIDRSTPVPHVQIELLRSVPIFSSLAGPTLEGIAHQLVPVSALAGTVVIREGDFGDRYYLIADGTLEVSREGRFLATIGRGQGFGEIALLHNSPRTSSVIANEDVTLYALDKDPFVLLLTGRPAARDTARATASGHLRTMGIDDLTAENQLPAPPDQ
jgi:MFS family permease